jgi:WD40 repeat protein
MRVLWYSISRAAVFWLCLTLPEFRAFGQNTPEIVWQTNLHDLKYAVKSVAFSPDGMMLTGSAGPTITLWRLSDKSVAHRFSLPAGVLDAAITPTLLGAGNGVGARALWRIADGTRLWSASGSERSDHSITYSVTFSPDGTAFAYGRQKGISVVASETGHGLRFENPLGRDGNERGVFDIRFSPDGTLLASANKDNTASLFRMPEGTLIRDLAGHSSPVMSVDFSPDGKLLTTSAGDGTARLWNPTNGAQVRVLPGGGGTGVPVAGSEGVGRARFSADGGTLLTSSNGTLRFWRVSDGKLLLTYTNVGNGVFAVSPDGKHFAYGTGLSSQGSASIVLARLPLMITSAAKQTNALNREGRASESASLSTFRIADHRLTD